MGKLWRRTLPCGQIRHCCEVLISLGTRLIDDLIGFIHFFCFVSAIGRLVSLKHYELPWVPKQVIAKWHTVSKQHPNYLLVVCSSSFRPSNSTHSSPCPKMFLVLHSPTYGRLEMVKLCLNSWKMYRNSPQHPLHCISVAIKCHHFVLSSHL